jgi:hypothetical protein
VLVVGRENVGPHAAELKCAKCDCGRFVGWMSSLQVEYVKRRIAAHGGRPSRPIEIGWEEPQGEDYADF